MTRVLTAAMAAVLAMAVGCGEGSTESAAGGQGGSATGAGGSGSERRDFRGFERFAIAQQEALGSCPDRTQVYAAELVRRDDGDFDLMYATLLSDDDYDACLEAPPAPPARCEDSIAQPARTVSAFDAAAVEGLFASLPVLFFPDPECEDYFEDPCRILRLTWDGFSVGDYACEDVRISDSFAEIILREVTLLATGSEAR